MRTWYFSTPNYFRKRVREAIVATVTPVERVVVDASPINVTDVTAMQKIDEFREERAEQGVVLAIARMKRSQSRFFNRDRVSEHQKLTEEYTYPALNSAIHAFNHRTGRGADTDTQ